MMDKKMRRLLVLFFAFLFVTVTAVGCTQPVAAAPAAQEPAAAATEAEAAEAGPAIKIGVITPLEGGGAVFGLKTQQGIDLFLEKINAEGGVNGRLLETIYMDDKGDATESTNAYNKIADEVAMIIGPTYSGCAIAVAPLAEEDGKVCITTAATNVKVVQAGKTMFRSCFKDDDYGTAMSDYASEKLGLSKFACLYNSADDYSVGLADAFMAESGDKLVISEAYGANDVDFKTQLTKIKAADVDAIFIPGTYSFVAPIMMQMKELDMLGIQILAQDAYGILGALSDKSVAEGMLVCDGFPTDSTEPQVKEFVEAFQAKYNEMPDQFAALAYDAAAICVEALKNAASDSDEDLLASMFAVSIPGVTGTLSFTEDGNQKTMNFLFQRVEGEALITIND